MGTDFLPYPFLLVSYPPRQISIGTVSKARGNFYLNRYDVANAPAQKTAMQVLASLGAEGKKALEYFAEENRSLASYVHANIELSYLGSSRIPVEENLQRLYCFRQIIGKTRSHDELCQR